MANSKRKKHKRRKKLQRAILIFAAAVLLTTLVLIILNGIGLFDQDAPLTDGLFSDVQVEQTYNELLGHDLELLSVGRYSGLYMEDGSMDPVTNVMMIRVKNTGDQDLQLARLSLTYSDGNAEFEITNLPAGDTMVVLEKNRRTYTQERHLRVSMDNVVFFQKNMDVFAQRYEITGLDGALNIKNISDSDISGDVYIYYKYISGDVLYGGITFRAKISNGLKAGELRQIGAGHFDPDHCIILSVTAEAA